MLAKVYVLRFTNLNDARSAATHVSEALGKRLGSYDVSGLTVLLRKEGIVKVIARFDCQKAFQRMQTARPDVLAEVQNLFPCMIEDASAVTVFSYERDATVTV
jgi:hypothetical protein